MVGMSTSNFSRPGAIDLSQLTQRAQQKAAGTQAAAPGGPGPSSAGSYVVEVTEATFDADIMRRSVKHPVVVEFYSPRVSTGQQLSTALAELAAEYAGKFLVARLNVDASPQIVQALGLQAVPTVVGVIGGQIAPLFQGVLSKDQVRTYLDELVKASVANGIVGRADPVGESAADPQAEAAPVADPRFAAADAALERGDFAAARAEFDRLLQTNPNDTEAKAGAAQAGLLARTAVLDPQQTLASAAAPGALLDTQLAAADIEMMTGQADSAFARLIALVKTSAGKDRDTVRLRLLELFETLGNADPRVLQGRRDLMTALF